MAVLVGAHTRILGLLGIIRSLHRITETVLVLPVPGGPQIRCTEDFSDLVAEMQLATASLCDSFSPKSTRTASTSFGLPSNSPHSPSAYSIYSKCQCAMQNFSQIKREMSGHTPFIFLVHMRLHSSEIFLGHLFMTFQIL